MKYIIAAAILSVCFWKSDAKAEDDITTILKYDKYTIDRCYFGSAAVKHGFRRTFEGCDYDGESFVNEKNYAIQRLECKVTYDPVEIYKSKIRKNYSAQYEFKLMGKDLYGRVILTDTSDVYENYDRACNLYKWRKV